MRCPCCGWSPDRPTPTDILNALKLSRHERRIAEALTRQFGRWVATEQVIAAVYFDDPDGGPDTADLVVRSGVHGLRRKLRGCGLAIESMSGNGSAGRRMVWASGNGTATSARSG